MMLERTQTLAYEIELKYTVDGALYQLQELSTAATQCVQFEAELTRQLPKALAPETLAAKVQCQRDVFDRLEAFLAVFARLSLLIFPIGKSNFTKERGETIQACLDLPANSPLRNRGLRDNWMHHDERLDEAVYQGVTASGQLFKLAAQVTEQDKQRVIRIIEIDTLVIHHRDRDGTKRSTNLHDVRGALTDLEARLKTAFAKLKVQDAEGC